MPELTPEDSLLVTRFFEGNLSPEESGLLALRLKRSPELRASYLEEADLVNLLRELPGEALSSEGPVSRRRHRLPAIGLAAAAVIAVAFFLPKSPSALSPQQASIKSLTGALLVNGKTATLDTTVSAGQTVELSGEYSSANLTFPDGSQLLLTGDSLLTLLTGTQRGIEMKRGVVHAAMKGKKKDPPFLVVTADSRLEAPATRFAIEMGEVGTRFVVNEGEVRLRSLANNMTRTVSTGVEVTRKGKEGFTFAHMETSPSSWQYDFETPAPEDFRGSHITTDLPPDSMGGALAVPSFIEALGRTFYQIGFRDSMNGLCQATANGYLEMTFRSRQPYWFNTFIHAIDQRDGGVLDVKIYKLDPRLLSRPVETREQWHHAIIPLAAFREQGDGTYNGPPPEDGLLITTFFVSSPAPERDLRLDAVAIHPSGDGKLILESLAQ